MVEAIIGGMITSLIVAAILSLIGVDEVFKDFVDDWRKGRKPITNASYYAFFLVLGVIVSILNYFGI